MSVRQSGDSGWPAPLPASSDTREARRLTEELVARDDTKLTEALLADAIGHLADAIDELRQRLESHADGVPYD